MISEHFLLLGLCVSALTMGTYVVSVVRGRVRPNRLSWFILAIAPMVAAAAEIQAGVGVRAVSTFWFGFAPLLVFIASFVNKLAYWKLNRFDLSCGALAVLALVLWALTGSGAVAIALSICADGLAILPILVKSWRFPHTESAFGFLGAIVNSSIAMLVLERHTFADVAFPIYILTSSVLLVGTVLVRSRAVTPRAQAITRESSN